MTHELLLSILAPLVSFGGTVAYVAAKFAALETNVGFLRESHDQLRQEVATIRDKVDALALDARREREASSERRRELPPG